MAIARIGDGTGSARRELTLLLLLAVGAVHHGRPAAAAGRARRSASVLQLAVIATGVLVPAMYFLGLLFAGVWVYLLWVRQEITPAPAPATAPALSRPHPAASAPLTRRTTYGSGRSPYSHSRRSSVDTERTLVLIKPDGVARGLVGDVVGRIERKGLRLAALELRTLDRETAETHYAEHREKPFFGPLVDFITSGPLVAAVVEGPRAIEAFRAARRRNRPGQGGHRQHPRRPRPRGAEQHRARLRLARVGQA